MTLSSFRLVLVFLLDLTLLLGLLQYCRKSKSDLGDHVMS